MKHVLLDIEAKRLQFEQHRFFGDLLDRTDLSGEERLAWVSCAIPFIMGYADLNKYVLRDNSSTKAADTLQQMLNTHTYEEDFHWQWMLDDLKLLGVDSRMTVSDVVRVFWSPEMRVSRQLCLEFAAIASRTPSFGMFTMVETIEAVSITIFRHCRGIHLRSGMECEFFGTKHYIAEASHLMKSDPEAQHELPTLTIEQREQAILVVDQVFALFHAWCDSLLDYASKYMASPLGAYERMIHESRREPRQASFPSHDTSAP